MLSILKLLIILVYAPLAPASAAGCRPDYEKIGKALANVDIQLEQNAFNVSRSLSTFFQIFNTFPRGNLADRLRSLGPRDHWIDMGAGMAGPMMNQLGANFDHMADRFIPPSGSWARRATSNSPRMTAVGISDDFSRAHAHPDNIDFYNRFRREVDPEIFQYRAGRPIEAYENPIEEIGRAQLITDAFGPTAYTRDLTRVLEQYLSLLDEGGAAYIHGMFLRTKILDKNGVEISAEEFLQRIRGIDFRISHSDHNSIRVNRESGPFSVPRLRLDNFYLDDKPPPYRVFQLVD